MSARVFMPAERPARAVIVHDFMVDEDLTGPASAALWMLVLSSAEPVCLTAGYVSGLMNGVGLEVVAADLVPTITKVVVGVKPPPAGSTRGGAPR